MTRGHRVLVVALTTCLLLPALALVIATETAGAYPTICGNNGTDVYDYIYDCSNPYGGRNTGNFGIYEYASLNYQGVQVGDIHLFYSPYCRTAWSEGTTFTHPYTNYYAWVNRIGAPGDSWGYADAWHGSFMNSSQLDDRNPRRATAWLTYKPGTNIFASPALGPTYGNTYPPY